MGKGEGKGAGSGLGLAWVVTGEGEGSVSRSIPHGTVAQLLAALRRDALGDADGRDAPRLRADDAHLVRVWIRGEVRVRV